MNEYLCRNFVAQQIVNELSLNKLNRRMGAPMKGIKASLGTKNNLDDEGSTNYKLWLTK